jgi:putative Holliday junction resolvase
LKILGIDHGNVRIGVAMSDETGSFARALTIIKHVSRARDAEEICRLCEKEACGTIIVGVPYDLDGGEGPRARSVLRFVDQLKSVCRVPVIAWDESFSTENVIATSIKMKKSRNSRREALDDEAAAMILQSYLDHQVQKYDGENA